MKTLKIYKMVLDGNGVKCSTIATSLAIPISSTSGILSMLKLRHRIYNNEGLWYVLDETPAVKSIKLRLLDISTDDFDTVWCEGYISGLCDMKVINERQFDYLLDWLKHIYE